MAREISYKADFAGTGELMRSAEMEAAMKSAAQKGRIFAESISPHRTGDYAASFSVSSTRRGGVHHDRAAAYLINNSDHALLVEVVDGYHVLARTAGYIREAGP